MKIRISASAETELEAIGDWIAKDNPLRALTFVQELRKIALSLETAPLAFPLLPRHEQSGIRRCVYRDYLIFYCVGESEITILHILHGAQDVDRIIFPQ